MRFIMVECQCSFFTSLSLQHKISLDHISTGYLLTMSPTLNRCGHKNGTAETRKGEKKKRTGRQRSKGKYLYNHMQDYVIKCVLGKEIY